MKKAFKLAAIALCASAMMVACNNNATEEVALDTMPVDTVVIDTVPTDTVVEEAPAEEAPAPAKAKTPAKQKTKVEEVKEGIQTVKAASLQVKKDVKEVSDELKKGGEGSMNTGNTTNANPLGAKKKSAAEAFKKN